MDKPTHICPIHKSRMFQRFNSTLWFCPECEKSKKSIRVDKLHSSTKKVPKNGLKSVKGKTPRQRAMDNADMWFSRYIRLKYSEQKMFGLFVAKCYTCGAIHDIKLLDNGHYVNREHKTVRFNEDNCRPQCTYCNRYRSGRHLEFGINLVKEIGSKRVDVLKQLSLFPGEDNEIFYREQSEIYRKKFNELLKERNITNPWKK